MKKPKGVDQPGSAFNDAYLTHVITTDGSKHHARAVCECGAVLATTNGKRIVLNNLDNVVRERYGKSEADTDLPDDGVIRGFCHSCRNHRSIFVTDLYEAITNLNKPRAQIEPHGFSRRIVFEETDFGVYVNVRCVCSEICATFDNTWTLWPRSGAVEAEPNRREKGSRFTGPVCSRCKSPLVGLGDKGPSAVDEALDLAIARRYGGNETRDTLARRLAVPPPPKQRIDDASEP